MPAPFQGAYKARKKQMLKPHNNVISSLKGKVAASFASRRKGCDTGNCDTPLRLDKLGTSPILRPIFHKMKNAGRVILDSKSARGRQEGQQNTNRLAQSLNEQLIYRSTTLSHRLRRCQLPFREHIKLARNKC